MFPDFWNVTYYQVKVGIFFWVKTSINGLLCLMLSWSHWSSVVCLKSVACHLQAYKLNLVAGVVQKSPLPVRLSFAIFFVVKRNFFFNHATVLVHSLDKQQTFTMRWFCTIFNTRWRTNALLTIIFVIVFVLFWLKTFYGKNWQMETSGELKISQRVYEPRIFLSFY